MIEMTPGKRVRGKILRLKAEMGLIRLRLVLRTRNPGKMSRVVGMKSKKRMKVKMLIPKTAMRSTRLKLVLGRRMPGKKMRTESTLKRWRRLKKELTLILASKTRLAKLSLILTKVQAIFSLCSQPPPATRFQGTILPKVFETLRVEQKGRE